MAAMAVKQKELGKAFLAKAAAAPGATKTPSGIVITSLKAGTGASPKASDEVKVHYEGKLVDGSVFDSSIKRGEPATFPLGGVIPCWTEAVQTMKVGGKSRIVCPPETAYGERGSPPRIAGGSTLVFDVELLDIGKAAPAPTAPPKP
jgi:FKBP-type peptidyl-prolyl cis-trans isomerase